MTENALSETVGGDDLSDEALDRPPVKRPFASFTMVCVLASESG